MGSYLFRRLGPTDAPQVFGLIVKRIEWMDQKGISQWNDTGYLEAYPLSYYESEAREGRLYGLCADDGRIVCAAVLLDNDERWDDNAPAVYLHNFVSMVEAGGAGTVFLEMAEADARQKGKIYFRLDSADDNTALAAYYTAHGFVPAGTCADGPYKGILRQKKL